MNGRITRNIVLTVLLLAAISRLAIWFTGFIGINLFASYSEPPVYERTSGIPEMAMKLPQSMEDTKPLDWEQFVKFDSFAYLKIAGQGYDDYRIDEPHPPANWVFFPLYPLLLKAANAIVGLLAAASPTVVGMVLSNSLLVGALLYVYAIGLQQQLDERQALLVLTALLAYPASLYFSLPYTESLFLFLSAASIYYATDRKYALAFAAAALSTVTRVPGFVNLFFVAGSVLLNEGFRPTWRHVRWALYALLSLVPMGLYLAYMKRLTGDFLAPFHEQSLSWYRFSAAPFANYVHYFEQPYFISPGGWDNGLISFVMSTVVFVVYIAYAAVSGKKLFADPKQLLLWVYGALLIVIPFSSQPWSLASVVRYMMVSIPFFLYLVKLTDRSEAARFAYMMLFMVLQVVYVIGFFNDYPFMA